MRIFHNIITIVITAAIALTLPIAGFCRQNNQQISEPAGKDAQINKTIDLYSYFKDNEVNIKSDVKQVTQRLKGEFSLYGLYLETVTADGDILLLIGLGRGSSALHPYDFL